MQNRQDQLVLEMRDHVKRQKGHYQARKRALLSIATQCDDTERSLLQANAGLRAQLGQFQTTIDRTHQYINDAVQRLRHDNDNQDSQLKAAVQRDAQQISEIYGQMEQYNGRNQDLASQIAEIQEKIAEFNADQSVGIQRESENNFKNRDMEGNENECILIMQQSFINQLGEQLNNESSPILRNYGNINQIIEENSILQRSINTMAQSQSGKSDEEEDEELKKSLSQYEARIREKDDQILELQQMCRQNE